MAIYYSNQVADPAKPHATRFDVRGKHYLDYPSKYYATVIDGHPMSARYIDNDGIGHINLTDFLLNPKSVETI